MLPALTVLSGGFVGPASKHVVAPTSYTAARASPVMKLEDDGILGVGVIGAGRIGLVHLEALAQCENVRAVIISNPTVSKAKAAADKYKLPESTSDAMDVINHPDVEAVWICSPSQYHADQIKACAKAGKHVFCEKPIAKDIDETIEAINACKAAGVQLMTALQRRFVRKPDSNPRPFALLELEFLCPSSLQSAEGRTFESHSGRTPTLAASRRPSSTRRSARPSRSSCARATLRPRRLSTSRMAAASSWIWLFTISTVLPTHCPPIANARPSLPMSRHPVARPLCSHMLSPPSLARALQTPLHRILSQWRGT
jgi:hypothetical protein